MESFARSLRNYSLRATTLLSFFSSSASSPNIVPPPSLSPDDLEMQAAAIAHDATTNLNPNNVDPTISSNTNHIDSARMDIRIWLAAATPLAIFYYQARPHVPSTLRFSLFAFMLAALVYFTGVLMHHKFPSMAKVTIQTGVGFAALSFSVSMGLMLL